MPFHITKLLAAAIAVPAIPNSAVNKTFNPILKTVLTIRLIIEKRCWPVIIKSVPTEPHNILINWPEHKITKDVCPFKNSAPKNKRISLLNKMINTNKGRLNNKTKRADRVINFCNCSNSWFENNLAMIGDKTKFTITNTKLIASLIFETIL